MTTKSLTPNQIKRRFGEEAYEALKKVRKGDMRRRRRTLLALADSVMLGEPKEDVYGTEGILSRRNHYRLLADDEDYRNAYHLLIGTQEEPGIAQRILEARVDEESLGSLQMINRAVNLMVDGSTKAAEAILDGLAAEEMKLDMKGGEHYHPDTRSRLAAARSLFEIIEKWRAEGPEEDQTLKLEIVLPDNQRDVWPDEEEDASED